MKLIKITGLRALDVLGTSEPYCVLQVMLTMAIEVAVSAYYPCGQQACSSTYGQVLSWCCSDTKVQCLPLDAACQASVLMLIDYHGRYHDAAGA